MDTKTILKRAGCGLRVICEQRLDDFEEVGHGAIDWQPFSILLRQAHLASLCCAIFVCDFKNHPAPQQMFCGVFLCLIFPRPSGTQHS